MTVLRSGAASDVGRVRSVNEDRLLESVALFAVADGMGGHAGGEVASSLAIEVLQQAFGTDPTAEGLVAAVRRANLAVWERSHRDAEVRGMGTTLTAAALVPTPGGDRLVVANVGDSRAYRWVAGRLAQMTTDHSVAEELVARGELSEAEAAVHPHRHILTRALGVGPEVEVDAWELAPTKGERFVLCSDGLTNEVDEERIARVLGDVPDPEQAARTLVAMANEHGGSDNITVVVLDVLVADDVPPAGGPAGRGGAAPGVARAAAAAGAGSAPPATGDGPGPSTGRGGSGAGVADGARGAGIEGGGPGRPGAAQGPRGATGRRLDGEAATGMAGAVATGAVSAGGLRTSSGGVRTAVTSRTVTVARPAAQPGPGASGAPAGEQDAAGSEPPETMARHVASALTDVMGRGTRSRRELAVLDDHRRGPRRRLTFRVALFVVLVLAVAAGAGAVVHAYAEDAWYVRLAGGNVTIFQGRPGGFLGFEPHVVRVTDLTSADVLSYRVPQLQAGVSEGSLRDADRFVANLRSEFCAVQAASASCPSPTGPPPGAAAGTSSSAPPGGTGTSSGLPAGGHGRSAAGVA